ncbi:TetR/AcrR family transcriptional regulator [Paenibacillaceae bacterium]|nr:TetR/AcrR family transcriptional regulator [Paenibacillaceae bacterium]
MNKKQLQSEETKKRVAESAKALFIQKGYAATSIEDIVESTGSSKGNIYYHFKSKQGLFLYLLDEWEQEWIEKWKEQSQTYATKIDKLYGMVEHLVINDLNHPLTKAADEFMGDESGDSVIQDRIVNFLQDCIAFNQELLQEGMDAGELEQGDAKTLGIILQALLNGLGEMTRQLSLTEVLKLYRDAMHVMLFGIAQR